MINSRKKISRKSKYYLQRLAVYFIGYSVAWGILFLVLKIISSDIAYGYEGIKNVAAANFCAYLFEAMAGIWFVVVIAMLIYYWKQILWAFQSQEEEAQQKKNEMLAYLAHDLRTPLTSVVGYAYILNKMERLETEEAREYLRVILEKSQLLDGMLEEFFEVTKLETGNAKLELTNLNLAEMLQQIVSEYTPILKEKELELQFEVVSQAMVKCDAAKMERVFDNLMRNAMKYAPKQTYILVSGKIDHGTFTMIFENDSELITLEQLENMFDSFVRLGDARSEVKGAGMGLAIVKEIITLHQGKVWAEYENQRLKICIQMNIMKLS